MKGDEFMRRLFDLSQGIEVIMVTGADSLISAYSCLNDGARYFIPKPVKAEDLNTCVDLCLDHFRRWNDAIVTIKQNKEKA